MSILHSQLAIYGAIDELVIEARKGDRGTADQKLLTAAAKLLPNSTGFGEAGWYRELEGFFNKVLLRTSTPVVFPSLSLATDELSQVRPPDRPAIPAPRPKPIKEPNSIRSPRPPGRRPPSRTPHSIRRPIPSRTPYQRDSRLSRSTTPPTTLPWHGPGTARSS